MPCKKNQVRYKNVELKMWHAGEMGIYDNYIKVGNITITLQK